MTFRKLLLAAIPLASLVSCGTTSSTPPSTLALDRPIDVAFACFGSLRITGGGRMGTTADPFATTATPIEACNDYALAAAGVVDPNDSNNNQPIDKTKYPLGQEDLPNPGQPSTATLNYYALILQSVSGTVAVATWQPLPPVKMIAGTVQVMDVDPLQPGASGISIGDLPVGIVTDRNGCFAVTANAGTCDLSTLDITSALDTPPNPIVDRLDVTNGNGDVILAKPAAIAGEPTSGVIGIECQKTPAGILYVAYPGCHRVAAIDAATGKIQSSIVFDAAGTATIDPDPNFTCPAECGAGGAVVAGTRPSSLDLVDDLRTYLQKPAPTRRLAIGADNSNKVTVVDLDEQHLPTAITQIPLEGAIGLTDVALSPQIRMGGTAGDIEDDFTLSDANGGPLGGQFQFVYAVATDGTVRVADTINVKHECDTQIDPRTLTGFTANPGDIAYLSCIPDNDKPRRAGAKGPGIQLVGDARPTAVTIVHAVPTSLMTPANPSAFMGYFATITATNGGVFVVNVDDDNYADVYDPTQPLSTWLPLVLPHQLRDRIKNRDTKAEEVIPEGDHSTTVPVCNVSESVGGAGPDVTSLDSLTDGPHLWPIAGQEVAVALGNAAIDLSRRQELPTIRQVLCTGMDATKPVSELAFAAPLANRLASFPDLRAMHVDEQWILAWEGPLSNDSSTEHIDGQVDRIGQVIVDGTGMRVVEGGKPFCEMGVEPFDEVILKGCDPNAGGVCGYGNTCFVHPDSPTGVGSCMPANDVGVLSDPCREFLISQRHYAATTATSGELRLIPRRHVLHSTPITGCASADQCTTLEQHERQLNDEPPANGAALPDPSSEPHHAWACEADPSRPGPNQCIMQCTKDEDCGDLDDAGKSVASGAVCDAGRCVEGVIPPLQCVETLQRYEVHASQAFVMIGSRSGYLHPIIADANGTCVKDPNASPTLVGRIPLTAPACTTGANPCSLTIDQTETEPAYAPTTDKPCELADPPSQIVTRQAPAIRFSNPTMTFELVDPIYPGDQTCVGDRKGGLIDVPTVFPGYAMSVRIVSGFQSYALPLAGAAYPINVVRGPQESIWVEDEGDFLSTTSVSTRGRVYRVEATLPGTINTLQ
ncbi:MAG TPA: hypothetical protein VL463_30515 [Kofleriaceae bacterium]|nr:hypothetical protein [Kofleriaceae bacterium]